MICPKCGSSDTFGSIGSYDVKEDAIWIDWDCNYCNSYGSVKYILDESSITMVPTR